MSCNKVLKCNSTEQVQNFQRRKFSLEHPHIRIRFQIMCIVFSLFKITLKVYKRTKMSLMLFLKRHVANQPPKNVYVKLEKHQGSNDYALFKDAFF